MKFCIDARTYFFRSGVGTYTRNIVPALAAAAPEHHFTAFISDMHTPADTRLDLPNLHIEVSSAPWEDRDNMTTFAAEADATNSNACFLPFCLTPFKINTPVVLNVNDILPVLHPEHFTPETAEKFSRHSVAAALASATKIICLSASTLNYIQTAFSIPAETMTVVYPGVSPRFKPRTQNETAKTLDKYNLQYRRYALFTGVVEPRKNIDTLIRAYELNEYCAREALPLIIAGKQGWDTEHIYNYVTEKGLSNRITFTGRIPGEDLPPLMSAAALFIYPSLREGFGLPVLEAMASGVPVAASAIPPIKEFATGAAILFDPRDGQSISQAITTALTDQPLADTLRTTGPERASTFTWTAAAHRILNALLEAAKN